MTLDTNDSDAGWQRADTSNVTMFSRLKNRMNRVYKFERGRFYVRLFPNFGFRAGTISWSWHYGWRRRR